MFGPMFGENHMIIGLFFFQKLYQNVTRRQIDVQSSQYLLPHLAELSPVKIAMYKNSEMGYRKYVAGILSTSVRLLARQKMFGC